MQTSLEKLRKFFRLEHENGYANTAIIGGLALIIGIIGVIVLLKGRKKKGR